MNEFKFKEREEDSHLLISIDTASIFQIAFGVIPSSF
jgi:hypothetical protein